jgi:predicted ferric reductase
MWYITRATGSVAFVLLTVTVVLGIVGATLGSRRRPRLVTTELHRTIPLLALGFLAVHILSAVLDSYAPVGVASVVIPFVSPYRPFWLGLGTIAFDLLLVLLITSLARVRMGYGAWRATHWAAYACWPIALWHALGTGTDAGRPLLLTIEALCSLALVVALWPRLAASSRPGLRTGVAFAALVGVLATIVFVAVGPTQPGWAKRAGTPANLLAAALPDRASTARSPEVPDA